MSMYITKMRTLIFEIKLPRRAKQKTCHRNLLQVVTSTVSSIIKLRTSYRSPVSVHRTKQQCVSDDAGRLRLHILPLVSYFEIERILDPVLVVYSVG